MVGPALPLKRGICCLPDGQTIERTVITLVTRPSELEAKMVSEISWSTRYLAESEKPAP